MRARNIINSKVFIYIETWGLFSMVLFLMLIKIVPIDFYSWVLGAIFLVTIIFSILHKTSFKTLGFRGDNLKESLIAFGVFTLIGVVMLLLVRQLVDYQVRAIGNWWENSFFISAVFIVNPIQTFIYRSFLFERLQKVYNNPWMIIISMSIIFIMGHLVFNDMRFMLYVAPAGIAWSILYIKYPNYYASVLSHSILGATVLILGLT